MKKLMIILAFLVFACGGGGGGGSAPSADIAFVGDSIARVVASYWDDTANLAIGGTTTTELIEFLNGDTRSFKYIIVSVGGCNFKQDYILQNIVSDYMQIYSLLSERSEKVFCLSLPPVGTLLENQDATDMNANIAAICGDGYIDIWNMDYTTYDGTHPDEQTSRAIIDMVKEAMSKL